MLISRVGEHFIVLFPVHEVFNKLLNYDSPEHITITLASEVTAIKWIIRIFRRRELGICIHARTAEICPTYVLLNNA